MLPLRFVVQIVVTGGTFLLGVACSVDLRERTVICEGAAAAEAHRIGMRVFLTPREGLQWYELLAPGRCFSQPPPSNAMELNQRLGPPDRKWIEEGREFVSYELAEGTLRMGLEKSSSGDQYYLSWILRLFAAPVPFSEVLEQGTVLCVQQLALEEGDQVVVLGDSRTAGVQITVGSQGLAKEFIWRLDSVPSP